MTSLAYFTLDFVRNRAREAADETSAFATLTLIDAARAERFCLETLSPTQYERFAAELQRRLREDGVARQSMPPLNERAHVAVPVLDIDDESPTEAAVLYTAATVRTAFAVHLGVASAACVAMRVTASGAHKYHVYFPHVPLVERDVLDVALKLARASLAIDRMPSAQRHLRVHGTDRRDESGRFTGAGIYRLIGGYDERGVPLQRNQEPPGCWHSVRAGESVIRRLLRDPIGACPRATTRVALNALPPRTARTIATAYVVAAAGGDEAREVQLLLVDDKASWFIVSSRLPCAECNDERTEHRILARLAAFSDDVGSQWTTIYRWALCLDCDRDVQSWTPPLCVPLVQQTVGE